MKRTILAAFLSAIISFAAYAQRGGAFYDAVDMYVDNITGVYAKGDSVRVYAKLTKPVDEPLQMRIFDAGKVVKTVDVALSETPKVVFRGAFDTAKSMMFFVSTKADPKKYSGVGFMVAPEDYRPGFEEPSDFLSYWNSQKKALRRSRMKVKKTRIYPTDVKDADKFEIYDVEISMPEGPSAKGYMAIPIGAEPKSLPIALFVHSAGVAYPFNKSTVKDAVKFASYGKGAIGFDLNAHGMLNGQPQSYYDNLNNGELKGYSTRPLTTRKDFYFRLMYLRELRTMDYLCSLREWDGKRALVYGESQGGGQSCALAGLDPRITAAVINVPAMTDWGGILVGRKAGWSASYGKYADTDTGRDILPYFDGALFLQHTKASIFVVAGLIDETCDPACVYAAFNASTSPDKKIYPDSHRTHSHVHGHYGKGWNDTIGKARTAFVEEHLK